MDKRTKKRAGLEKISEADCDFFRHIIKLRGIELAQKGMKIIVNGVPGIIMGANS